MRLLFYNEKILFFFFEQIKDLVQGERYLGINFLFLLQPVKTLIFDIMNIH